MDFLSIGLLSLLHVSPAVKLATSGSIAARGLALRYPVAVFGLAASACLQAAMLHAWWSGGTQAYAAAWKALTPWQIGLTLAVAAECLWKLAAHFPLPRNLVILLVGVFGVLSLLTVLPASLAMQSTPVNMRRHWKLVAFVILGLSRVSLVSAEPGLRPNVRRYSAAVLCSMGGSILGDVIFSLGRGYWIVAVGQAVLLLSPLAACRWWWAISGAGEAWERTPGPSLASLDRDLDRIHEEIKARRAGAGE